MEQIDNIVVVVALPVEAFSLGGEREPSGRPPMKVLLPPPAQPILQEGGEGEGGGSGE